MKPPYPDRCLTIIEFILWAELQHGITDAQKLALIKNYAEFLKGDLDQWMFLDDAIFLDLEGEFFSYERMWKIFDKFFTVHKFVENGKFSITPSYYKCIN